jgi:hypothetical protein
MKYKVKWYNKGKWEEEEFETKRDPYIKIVKYSHSDSYSYDGYRFWAIDLERKTILESLEKDKWVIHNGRDISLDKEEIESVKSDIITLTNNFREESSKFNHYKYSDLINKYGEDAIYF